MAKRVTTLFIEDTAIRLLVARGRQVEKWTSIPLEAGLVKHGQVQDKEKVAVKLKDALQWVKTGNKVVLGLSEPGSLYRIVSLPKLPEAILAEAVKREAERVIPLPQNEIYLAYQTISSRQDEMQLFLAAFSRNTVDTLIGTLQAAGIKVTSLDLVPLCLCRIVDRESAIIVSLRSSNFEIAIMINKIPQVIRSLSLPGEAESLADKLPTIAEELDRTISFYNSSHTDKPLDNNIPVFVDGDLTQAPESWPLLAGNLGNNVAPLTTTMEAAADFDISQFTVNIGLILKENPREIAGTTVNFNALPKNYLPEKPKLSRLALLGGAGIGVIILVFVALQSSSVGSNVKTIQSEIESVQNATTLQNKEITSIKAQTKTAQDAIQPLQDQIKAVGADAAAFKQVQDSLNNRRTQVDTYVSKVISLIPASMYVNSINMADGIVIDGSAIEPDITLFARNLRDSNTFDQVIIKSISLNEAGNPGFYDFEIDVTLK